MGLRERARARSVLPKVSEAMRRQRRIAHGVLDILVAEIGLQRQGIDALIGELVAASVPQHVRMDDEIETRDLAEPLHHDTESARRERCAALRDEDEWRRRLLLALKPAQGAHFRAAEGWTHGEPFLTRLTCRRASRKSTCSQRSETASAARRPCR